jgi:hypothetical protein
MNVAERFDQFHHTAKTNKWYRYFYNFCRIALALGFLPSGYIKVIGERFTALPPTHPLGRYFDALHLTGFYYTFLGIVQLLIAALLLIPRTAFLGAMMYFPVIANICVLAYAVRFEGTRITTLMLLANMYLLFWNYDRLKYMFAFKSSITRIPAPAGNRFPLKFFSGVIIAIASVIVINNHIYAIRPGNSMIECNNGCPGNSNPEACKNFCDCIYNQGRPLDSCLKIYNQSR